MRDPLPPDLSRLGDEIVVSVARDIRAGRRRAALLERATVTAAAALILAAGVPSAVGPAVHTGPEPLVVASLDSTGAEVDRRPGCDQLRSATFAYPRPCRRLDEKRTLSGAEAPNLIQRRL